MLLFARPGDRLVLGGGERGRGGAETQPPERDSHSGPTGEKWTPHHHHPSGTTWGGVDNVLHVRGNVDNESVPT